MNISKCWIRKVTRILPSENYFIQKCCFKNVLLPVKLPSSFASFSHYYFLLKFKEKSCLNSRSDKIIFWLAMVSQYSAQVQHRKQGADMSNFTDATEHELSTLHITIDDTERELLTLKSTLDGLGLDEDSRVRVFKNWILFSPFAKLPFLLSLQLSTLNKERQYKNCPVLQSQAFLLAKNTHQNTRLYVPKRTRTSVCVYRHNCLQIVNTCVIISASVCVCVSVALLVEIE